METKDVYKDLEVPDAWRGMGMPRGVPQNVVFPQTGRQISLRETA